MRPIIEPTKLFIFALFVTIVCLLPNSNSLASNGEPKTHRAPSASDMMTGYLALSPDDPDFFGTYYGSFSTQITVKYKVKFLLWKSGVKTKSETIEISNMKLHLDYHYTSYGGFFNGMGEGTYKGQKIPFSVGGKVIDKGKGWGMVSLMLPKYRTEKGYCSLSSDGLQITIPIMNRKIILRKDAGPNTPPKVMITSPSPSFSQSLEYGQSYAFTATVMDAQQKTIPDERLVWKSDRDGFLSGRGLSIFPDSLSPGKHIITLEATDDGGLKGTDSITVVVTNDPPEKPAIILPNEDDHLYVKTAIIFQGKAYDLEDGWLVGGSLKWSSNVDGYIGNGNTLTTYLKTPGMHIIRLTATDSVGMKSYTERVVYLDKYTGNSPPQVIITEPKHLDFEGLAVQSGKYVTFIGKAGDTEDPMEKLTLEWHISASSTNNSIPEKLIGVGEKSGYKLMALGGPTMYTITFSARDTAGLEGKTSIKIMVLPWTID